MRLGRRITDTLTDYWEKLTKLAEVRRIRLHDARHTCGTLMHLQGVPIAVISEWLGHADSAFTMRTYVLSQDTAMVSAAGTLEAVVTKRDKKDTAPARRNRRRGRESDWLKPLSGWSRLGESNPRPFHYE
ncbi:tyrosine-type recombinase/integrase [Nocardia goodfellowii]